MRFGADYYPEYWGPEKWVEDARMMQELGFNIVRIGEFAWKTFEPGEGRYEFALFDEAIGILRDHGIDVVMCTPTAAPPAWVEAQYPRTGRIRLDGVRERWGARKQYCHTSATYRRLSWNVSRAMAEHYANFPGVVAWQTDNEFYADPCYCPECEAAFRKWLFARYGTPDELNRRWGMRFWGMEIGSFEEMIPPVMWRHPSHELAFRRFQNAQVRSFQKEQIDVIKQYDPDIPITHNFMATPAEMDYDGFGEDLDFVSVDYYPKDLTSFPYYSYAYDYARGFNRGPGFWVMEMQCGYITREVVYTTPPPGMIRLWTHQAIAHGADGIVYFRWRACPSGHEQFHSGILQPDSSKKGRSYREVAEIAKEIPTLRQLGVQGSSVKNNVAILRGLQNGIAARLYNNGSSFNYDDELQRYYGALFGSSIGVDVIEPTHDFSQYKLVIAPLMMIVDDDLVRRIEAFVQAGGTFITSYRAGIYDEDAVITTETLPGKLANVLGIAIHDFDWLRDPKRIDPKPIMRYHDTDYEAIDFADCIEPGAAAVVASYTNGWFSDYAAVTRNTLGGGSAYCVGGGYAAEFYKAFLQDVCAAIGAAPVLKTPEGLVALKRETAAGPLYWVLNHTMEQRTLDLAQPMAIALTGERATDSIVIPARGVLVLKPL